MIEYDNKALGMMILTTMLMFGSPIMDRLHNGKTLQKFPIKRTVYDLNGDGKADLTIVLARGGIRPAIQHSRKPTQEEINDYNRSTIKCRKL